MVKKVTIDGAEVDYIDVDACLYEMLKEFKNQKEAFQKSLEKSFMDNLDTYSADSKCSFDNFKKMIENIQMGTLDQANMYFDPLIDFPGEISIVRAYIFCLTSGEANNDAFSPENFISGLSRFGIENPVPCVSQRLSLYGNSRTIMDMLKKAEKKYGSLNLRVHSKIYT